jgi:hypothetical protein
MDKKNIFGACTPSGKGKKMIFGACTAPFMHKKNIWSPVPPPGKLFVIGKSARRHILPQKIAHPHTFAASIPFCKVLLCGFFFRLTFAA